MYRRFWLLGCFVGGLAGLAVACLAGPVPPTPQPEVNLVFLEKNPRTEENSTFAEPDQRGREQGEEPPLRPEPPPQEKPHSEAPGEREPPLDDGGSPEENFQRDGEGPEKTPEPPPELPPEPPQDRPPQTTLTVAVIADLNGSYGSTSYDRRVHNAVTALRSRYKPDLVLSAGDMVAGQKKGLNYAAMWRAFHQAVTIPLQQARIPLAVTPGNHDASAYAAYKQERQQYVKEWKNHKPKLHYIDDTSYPLRYAFRLGSALFVSLDASTVGPRSSSQRAWVETVLQRGQHLPVKIVLAHLPLYPVTKGRETEILRDTRLEQLLVRYKVTAFVSGHHHGYYPGKRPGLRLISAPCLGGGPRPLVGTTKVSARGLIILKISQGRLRSVEAYEGQNLDQRIERKTLPSSLNQGTSQVITRDDLPLPP